MTELVARREGANEDYRLYAVERGGLITELSLILRAQ